MIRQSTLTVITCLCFILTTSAQRNFQSFDNDPAQARIYTLKNGLTVYLSQNKDKPRIQTYFAVRAGSKNDPTDATGLAHYLEHMLFKGTHELGTLDWEAESKMLKEISDLYEKLRTTTDEEKRKAIYTQIDKKSNEAAQKAVPNEYDKLVSSMGAKGTNAYTSLERTVYINDIPANELQRFLKVESDRFRTLVLRLFHTELETVYEEFNRAQDNDYRKVFYSTMSHLFQKHTYGTQTTLGEGEHLKNPSMEKIHAYFNTYYRPNNCALILVGDLDFDQTMDWVEKYYADWEPGEIPAFEYEQEEPITSPVVVEKFGPDKERVAFTYRFPWGYHEDDVLKMELIDMILNNGQAGLIDLNLVQRQKVLAAGCYPSTNHDYAWHQFYGEPRQGQSLEQVKELILGQIEKIKKGEFEDWVIDAVIKDLKLSQIRGYESNRGRANAFVNAFIMRTDWDEYVTRLDRKARITKEELVAFANKHYNDNYIVVYKRTGEDKDVLRLEKPALTPLDIDRTTQSEYAKKVRSMPETRLKPLFLDYEKDLGKTKTADGLPFYYMENKVNDLFSLYYILDVGSDFDKKLALAVEYLPYLGTSKYSSEELKKELFKLGLNYNVFAGRDRVYVYISGLQESMEDGVVLLEHLLDDVQQDPTAYKNLVDDILKQREDAKLNKNAILWSGLMNYAKHGPDNPFTDKLDAQALRAMNPLSLVSKLRLIPQYPHKVFYYGPNLMEATRVINTHHTYNHAGRVLLAEPEPFEEKEIDKTEIYFVDYDMVQTQFVMVAKDEKFNNDLSPSASVFREYFGSGLSSIVFQEIREAKALAYSAFSSFTTPSKPDESHYVYGFVGTQTDKLPDALNAMTDLMNNMPKAEQQFNAAVDAVKKKIETDRITKSSVFWNYLSAQRKGLDFDNREKVYKALSNYTLADLESFFNNHIKGKEYKILIIGKKDNIDFEALEKIGPIREFNLKELFGY